MAWIGNDGIDVWALRFHTTNPSIAIDDTRQVLGFIEHYSKVEEGYIDCFYVSPDFQKIGIGQSLYLYAMQQLVEDCKVVQVYASEVAKPFFIKQGFCVVSENTVIKNGVKLDNWLMTLNSVINAKF